MDAPCPSTRTSSTTCVAPSGPVNPVVLLVTAPTFASALAPPISRCTLHHRPCRRCHHDVRWFPARPLLLPVMSCDVSAASTDVTRGALHMNSRPLPPYVPAVAACRHRFVSACPAAALGSMLPLLRLTSHGLPVASLELCVVLHVPATPYWLPNVRWRRPASIPRISSIFALSVPFV
ncbi:hypothetical protein WOLCODRAFT_140422, partial [Wolfiporia cocos MD-104 SS10]